MIKLTIRMDNQKFRQLAYAKKMTITEIADSLEIKDHHIVAFKIGKKYVNGSFLVEKDSIIDLITSSDVEGHRIYQDTAIFVLTKAFNNLFPIKSKIIVEHSISDGVFCHTNYDEYFSEETLESIKNEMQRIISVAMDIEKIEVTTIEAQQIFVRLNRTDLLKNMHYLASDKITLFKCGSYYDYYIRPLADNTSRIRQFQLIWHNPGFILRFPKRGFFTIEKNLLIPEKLFNTHKEYDKWLGILGINDVTDLNKKIIKYEINEMIIIEEALQEKKIAYIADFIKQKEQLKLVLIAGPSSSGKTTFARRLSIQLRVNGLKPLVIGLDDYFLPRHLTPKLPNGDYDYETIKALDISLLNKHLKDLLKGKEITLPHYNFIAGDREESSHLIHLGKNNIIVMEGIHGINEELTAEIPAENKIKIYVSALNQLNIDDHNRIPTTDVRKIRRIIRDKNFRGYSAEETLLRWPAVRNGEDKNIFPFQEQADFMFNSGLTYELGVLKKQAERNLSDLNENSPVFLEAERLINLLSHIKSIESENVPSNSLLREFIGGSIFKY